MNRRGTLLLRIAARANKFYFNFVYCYGGRVGGEMAGRRGRGSDGRRILTRLMAVKLCLKLIALIKQNKITLLCVGRGPS